MAALNYTGETKDYTGIDGMTITRKRTQIERDVSNNKAAATEAISFIPETEEDFHPHFHDFLKDTIFCGHLVTDLDSIAGAIGAAHLYGGIPARASEVNSETAFALKYWDVEIPEPIEEMLVKHPKNGVCLVDHQQTSQLNPAIDVGRIVGVIDHHALQNSTIVTDIPIYMDIRPWGSMSSIIAHQYMCFRMRPPRKIAGMLLCAILSDTLNLQGPTTTEWDKLMVAILSEIAGVEDIQKLASDQFKAKSSELGGLTAHQLCNGDQKVFTFTTEVFNGSVGFAVIETTDDAVIMSRAQELLMELASDKEKKGLTILYLAVVNIVELKSYLLLLGEDERSLALASFPNGVLMQPADEFLEPDTMDLGGLVSRKKDFIPSVTRAIKAGWSCRKVGSMQRSHSDIALNSLEDLIEGKK